MLKKLGEKGVEGAERAEEGPAGRKRGYAWCDAPWRTQIEVGQVEVGILAVLPRLLTAEEKDNARRVEGRLVSEGLLDRVSPEHTWVGGRSVYGVYTHRTDPDPTAAGAMRALCTLLNYAEAPRTDLLGMEARVSWEFILPPHKAPPPALIRGWMAPTPGEGDGFCQMVVEKQTIDEDEGGRTKISFELMVREEGIGISITTWAFILLDGPRTDAALDSAARNAFWRACDLKHNLFPADIWAAIWEGSGND